MAIEPHQFQAKVGGKSGGLTDAAITIQVSLATCNARLAVKTNGLNGIPQTVCLCFGVNSGRGLVSCVTEATDRPRTAFSCLLSSQDTIEAEQADRRLVCTFVELTYEIEVLDVDGQRLLLFTMDAHEMDQLKDTIYALCS